MAGEPNVLCQKSIAVVRRIAGAAMCIFPLSVGAGPGNVDMVLGTAGSCKLARSINHRPDAASRGPFNNSTPSVFLIKCTNDSSKMALSPRSTRALIDKREASNPGRTCACIEPIPGTCNVPVCVDCISCPLATLTLIGFGLIWRFLSHRSSLNARKLAEHAESAKAGAVNVWASVVVTEGVVEDFKVFRKLL
jgi:hypothetical protein